MSDKESLECVCCGNWRLLVSEYEDKISKKYVDTNTRKEYTFFGIVWGDDDFYYGMSRKGELILLSCVGSIDGHGYKEINEASWTECEYCGLCHDHRITPC